MNIKTLIDSNQPHTLQKTLRCLLSSAFGMPQARAAVLYFLNPFSDQEDSVRQARGTEISHSSDYFESIEKAISAQKFDFSDTPQDPYQLGITSQDFLYRFSLSPLSLENQLWVVAREHLNFSQKQHLQTVAQAIASHLTVWHQHHRAQAKTSELETVLGSVEHQVRQSLGLVNLYLSLLEGQPLDQHGQTVTHNLRTTVTEIAERLTTILGRQNQPITTLPVVDLRQLVCDRGRTFSPSLQAKELTLHIPDETVWLQAEPHQIGQVLDNLLCNAIAFSPPGAHIAWMWESFDGEVLIQITDQGPGIPVEALPHIFQSGYTQRLDGQGLGLAIVHKIVSQHGGRIWANNLSQGGAQFSIIFPQTPPPQS